jgi:hypothetical protein
MKKKKNANPSQYSMAAARTKNINPEKMHANTSHPLPITMQAVKKQS